MIFFIVVRWLEDADNVCVDVYTRLLIENDHVDVVCRTGLDILSREEMTLEALWI